MPRLTDANMGHCLYYSVDGHHVYFREVEFKTTLYLYLFISWLEGSGGVEAHICRVPSPSFSSPPAPWAPGGHGARGAWVSGAVDCRELWSAIRHNVLWTYKQGTIVKNQGATHQTEEFFYAVTIVVPACWRALLVVLLSCLFPFPPWAVFCLSWASLRSDELVLGSESSRARYPPVPPLLSRTSPALGEITPRPSRATLEGCVGDLSTAGGGMGGGGRSEK